MNFISKYYTSKAIVLFFVLQIAIFLFLNDTLPARWLVFSNCVVILFFAFSNFLSVRWSNLPTYSFRKSLFRTSLIVQIIWVFFSYFLFRSLTGVPFEYDAGDSFAYHSNALWMSHLVSQLNFSRIFEFFKSNYSDLGYNLYLSTLYVVTGGSIIITRLIKAILGAYTVVFVYKIATRNFGESAGRLAAILTMLLPNLIYYAGLHTKEAEMVFLLLAFANQADILIHTRKFRISKLLVVLGLIISLFLFRTVLGVVAIFALFSTLVFTSSRVIGNVRRVLIMLFFGAFVLILYGGKLGNEMGEYWSSKSENLEQSMEGMSSISTGNQFAKFGKTAIFAPIILVAPFPTLVNIQSQQNIMMLAGAYYTRNIYAFFVLVGLLWLIRLGLWRNHLFILVFAGGYLAVLSMSGFALSERFHLPAVPFLIILASLGISKLRLKHKTIFVLYMIIISIIILGWNWFKMAGRGLV